MRLLLVGSLIASGFLVLLALIGLPPGWAAPAPASSASSPNPVVPALLNEQFLDPGPGLFPGGAALHPRSGEVWVCRRGGATILQGAELRDILPGSCALNFHAQTDRWFAAEGRSVLIMSGTTPVARVTLPYTVTGLVQHPRTQLLYVTMQRHPWPPISTDLAVLSGTTVLTTMSALDARLLTPHPESGDLYMGVYTGTNMLWILSGTERVAHIPIAGPLYELRYHPYTRLTYVAARDELKILNGRQVSAALPVTETYQIAVDPESERAYATHLIPRYLTVLSRTEVITRIPFPNGPNPIAVIPGSGEIVVGAFPDRSVHVFSRDLSPLSVLTIPVRPRIISALPDGWAYVSGWGVGPVDGETPPSALWVLSRSVSMAGYVNGFGLGPLALSPDGGRLYALNPYEGYFYVLSGTETLTSSVLPQWPTAPVQLPRGRWMALDPGTGWVYVGHPGFSLLWIFQGSGWMTRTLEGSLNVLTADPERGVIWGGGGSSSAPPLFVITGTTVSTIPIGDPEASTFLGPVREIALDPERNYLYALGPFHLAVFSLTTPITASFWLTTVGAVYPPQALAVQPASGLAYVGSGMGTTGTLWIFEGPTLRVSRTMAGVPIALAADPQTGWVYAALSGTRQVAVLTGTALAFTVSLPFEPRRIWISPRSHLAYGAGEVQVAALDGPAIRRVLTTGIFPRDMVFDPRTGLAVLSHEGDNRLVWIEERALDRRLWLPLVMKGR
ncbi:hypothetical protein [Thermoflexus sp.]|uniref:YncE family protein n=1 Tax=Thermoflexus sp. TaxID=1969742 RepID=UPI002ADE6F38|nr:hypothetical protein [Thermoflexus sp.]